ncbi:DJ-1/PfpI family protein [Peribacillus alkalitolerans]|uniref:DJ-1/PfpI family protein n=1 Tax=Peribacillus alkalitolerans TaxID=1550385 RepID=UPI0013D1752B|nr:DJ-1/PfpI family protein [Peribacillus alkalitolerans]
MLKKTVVLLYPNFSEYELTVALSILMQGQKPTIIVGLNNGPIKGESGLTVLPDTTVDEVEFSEIDSLLLTGCMDITPVAEDHRYIAFIQKVAETAEVIASISSSPLLLAKAGVLKGKKYTVGLTEETINSSGVFETENYLQDLVVQDGHLITARGRGFITFGKLFGKALDLKFDERWYLEIF